MKKLLLYIVLISYAIVMVKPALPYVSDFIWHVLFYKQHLATVHFENGQYHVHKEVAKNAKDENSNQRSFPEKKKTGSAYEYTVTAKSFLLIAPKSSIIFSVHLSEHNIPPYLANNYPPPKG